MHIFTPPTAITAEFIYIFTYTAFHFLSKGVINNYEAII